ncbi:MAG: hypothetical protein KDA61_13905, partial [Planctomycetales bacterium]|nr:hypothetical protein [Planctomycetales bacterium]
FDRVAASDLRLGAEAIERFYHQQILPPTKAVMTGDPLYQGNPVLYRRVSGNVRVTIFDGGHEILHRAALTWLARQRKGQNAEWEVASTHASEEASNASPAGD